MRCIVCQKLSFDVVCKSCQSKLLKPTITTRYENDLNIISFFGYHNIESLLLTKHTPLGYRVYKLFGRLIFRPFLQKFVEELDSIYIIPIDDRVTNGYSHTALLAHYSKSTKIIPLYNSLRALNPVKYAGKSKEFRLNNPREFIYTGKRDIQVILIDDIVTTSLTLQEAKNTLISKGVDVVFALTLADAKL